MDFFPHEGEHIPEYMAALRTYDAVVMGRRTYDFGLNVGVTDPYPWMETYVFSRTMKESPNPRVKVVAEDAPGVVPFGPSRTSKLRPVGRPSAGRERRRGATVRAWVGAAKHRARCP